MIYKRPSAINESKGQVFCSSACYGISCRKEIACHVCGKLILAGFNKKTCSRSCANKNREGIKYTGARLKDKAIDLRRIKIKLFGIKGKVCERCGYNKSEILQVHHKNRNREDDSIENLEIICPNCHYEEHHLSHFKKS
jgi:ribosomal protein L37E